MFDIGFAELFVIGLVALLVIGPERLPATIKTASLWINRIRRGFNDIKREVQQELHNDSVMNDLRDTGERLKQDAQGITQDLHKSVNSLTEAPIEQPSEKHEPTPPENSKPAEAAKSAE